MSNALVLYNPAIIEVAEGDMDEDCLDLEVGVEDNAVQNSFIMMKL